MWHIRNRRLLISAAAGVLLWLVAVLAVLAWRHPQFWIGSGERFARAQTLAAEQQWAGALAEVDHALDRDPENAGYLTFRGYRQLDLVTPAAPKPRSGAPWSGCPRTSRRGSASQRRSSGAGSRSSRCACSAPSRPTR